MTTFLWVLAAIGAVVFAWLLAFALGRAAGGHHEATIGLPDRARGTRYEQDNAQRLNPAAFLTFGILIALIVGLIVLLELT